MVFSNKTKEFYENEELKKAAEAELEKTTSSKDEAKALVDEAIKKAEEAYNTADKLMDEAFDMVEAYTAKYDEEYDVDLEFEECPQCCSEDYTLDFTMRDMIRLLSSL